MKNILKHCLNPKVLIGIVVIIILLYIFVPQVAGYSWILLVLLCPLSMILMMAGMKHEHDAGAQSKLYVCPECGLSYEDKEWAKKCGSWCKEHKSCNLDIIAHAVEQK